MDRRPPPLGGGGASIRRPAAPPRAVSGGSYAGSRQLPKRPTLPSGLSNVRSASQPVNVVDLTAELAASGKGNAAAFLENEVKMVTSPDVINIDDDDEAERPAKRMKTEGDDFHTDDEDMDVEEADALDDVIPGSPLPGLSKLNRVTKNGRAQRRNRYGDDSAARKAHGIEPPAMATRVPPPKKALDFSPWLGNHPEDILTETVVKNGYSDGVKNANHTECNSAKASIWPNLSQKNNQGLNYLSLFFSTVMDKRQVVGRSTAPSTFKPPPRVTVTDTKREAWLRDLANPEVPLRKQSRTIPHGIRGKLLMDQCLSKAIPLQRAVWLAKCVGANELRAFRRKGVSGSTAASGEAKWVREWTVHVEQFLESVISTCGQKEWQSRMNYAVKLATAFFAEKLLDMDHYLDWIATSLAQASLDTLPIWIVMAQLYWKPITAYSKRGKAFAEGILEHLRRITQTGLEASAALKARLQKLVAVLAVSNRGCLIIPRVWSKYKDLLSPQTGAEASMKSPANDIARRNERLAAPLRMSAVTTSSPILDVYQELDQVGLNVDIEKLVATCLALVPDTSTLVNAFLNWSSTLYRTGDARIYLAARLIAQLNANGNDTDAAILRYLGELKGVPAATAHNVHMVIVDLLGLEAFSVGRYLQWLISRGSVASNQEENPATSLLTSIPTDGLPLHLINTRKTLLRRLGLPVEEDRLVHEAVASMDSAIATSSTEHAPSVKLLGKLTLSANFAHVRGTCAKLAIAAKDGSLTLGAFNIARSMVERIGDLPSLADLASAASSSDIPALLATVCDTVNYHAEPFAAQGKLEPLVQGITEQYTTLRSQQPLDRSFIVALVSLVSRTPEKTSFVKLLNDDLAICEQQTSLMVCSPASDSLIGMQATSLDSDHDIDAVFASGNTMDEQLMQRVFLRIMEYASKGQPATSEPVSSVCGWLNQLRLVDGSGAFERIVQNYVRGVLKSADSKTVSHDAFDLLVASGSLQLSAIADTAKDVATPPVATAVLGMLLSGDVDNPAMSECERYRLLMLKKRCRDDQGKSLAALFRLATETPDLDVEDPELINFIIGRSSAKPGSVRCFFDSVRLSTNAQANAGRIVSAILRLDGPALQLSPKQDLHPLVRMAGPLSVRYCVEAIRWMRSSTNWTLDDDDTLKEALLDCFGQRSEVWPQLLEVASDKVKLAMHEWAQEEILDMAGNEDSTGIDETAKDLLQRLLNLLAVTNQTATKIDGTAFVDKIVSRLKDVEAGLSEVRSLDVDREEAFASVTHRLHMLLHLCVLHVHKVPDESDASAQARTHLLAALCSLLVNPALQPQRDLVEYIFDLASTLADNLLDDSSGAQKAPSLSRLPSNARLAFIFGTTPNPTDSWLALASPPHPPPMLSQQQRALHRHPSQHLQPQMGSRAPTPAQQHSPVSPHPLHARWPSHGGAGPSLMRPDVRMQGEVKTTPFALRRWEIMPDPTPVMGENDTSLSLSLFGARKV